MGFSEYQLSDGRMAGYAVEADCDHPTCTARINRGLGYLCGQHPGCGGDPEPGCGDYFCEDHRYTHDCPSPACGLFPAGGGMSCELIEGHELPHRNEDGEFTSTERPLLRAVCEED